jgi:hypothetical protein
MTEEQADKNFDIIVKSFKDSLPQMQESDKAKLFSLYFEDLGCTQCVYDTTDNDDLAEAVRVYGLTATWSAYCDRVGSGRWLYADPNTNKILPTNINDRVANQAEEIVIQMLRFPKIYAEFMWAIAPALCDICNICY